MYFIPFSPLGENCDAAETKYLKSKLTSSTSEILKYHICLIKFLKISTFKYTRLKAIHLSGQVTHDIMLK